MNKHAAECRSCLGLAGTPRISPGPPIHIGEYWQVEHAYPSKLLGWLVVVPRAHDLPEQYRGAGSFAFLQVPAAEAVDRTVVRDFCETLQKTFEECV